MTQSLEPGQIARFEFRSVAALAETPTVKFFAGEIELGSGTVIALTGATNAWQASFALPSNVEDGTVIKARVDGDGLSTLPVVVGVVGIYRLSSSGGGLVTVAVKIIDEDESGVAGCRVGIEGSGRSTTTDDNGDAKLHLSAGEYTLIVATPSGFSTPESTPIVVASDSLNIQIETASETLPGSTDPALCNVAVDVIDENGQPIQGALVFARIAEDFQLAANAAVFNTKSESETDVNGRAVLTLIRSSQFASGGEYTITINTVFDSRTFSYLVPDSAASVATQQS